MKVVKFVIAGSCAWESSREVGPKKSEFKHISRKLDKERGDSEAGNVALSAHSSRVNADMRERCMKAFLSKAT